MSTDFDNPVLTVDININFTNVGIDENGISHVSVYPNLASGLFRVEGAQLSCVVVNSGDGRPECTRLSKSECHARSTKMPSLLRPALMVLWRCCMPIHTPHKVKEAKQAGNRFDCDG